jgi:Flp pilus assembly protein CpaB
MALGSLSLLLGGAAASGISDRERAMRAQVGDPVPVLVASRGIAAGSRIVPGSLAIRQVPRRWAPVGTLNRVDQAFGMVASVRIPEGAYISTGTWRDPGSDRASGLAADERVATVIAFAPPDAVRPGMRVDVVIARTGSRPVLALRAAEVLAVRTPSAGLDGDGGGHRVEADLKTKVPGALRLAEAGGSSAEIRLLPIGGGG